MLRDLPSPWCSPVLNVVAELHAWEQVGQRYYTFETMQGTSLRCYGHTYTKVKWIATSSSIVNE